MLNYLYLLGTVSFGVYSNLILKWQVSQAGAFPEDVIGKVTFILRLFLSPWLLSGLVSAFLALVCWMAAMTKFELSHAYPFTSLTFVFLLVFSAVLFHELMTVPKLMGVALILAGIVIGSRG